MIGPENSRQILPEFITSPDRIVPLTPELQTERILRGETSDNEALEVLLFSNGYFSKISKKNRKHSFRMIFHYEARFEMTETRFQYRNFWNSKYGYRLKSGNIQLYPGKCWKTFTMAFVRPHTACCRYKFPQ